MSRDLRLSAGKTQITGGGDWAVDCHLRHREILKILQPLWSKVVQFPPPALSLGDTEGVIALSILERNPIILYRAHNHRI